MCWRFEEKEKVMKSSSGPVVLKVWSRPAAAVSPEHLIKMQFFQPYPKVIDSGTLGVEPSNWRIPMSSRWICGSLKLENHYFRVTGEWWIMEMWYGWWAEQRRKDLSEDNGQEFKMRSVSKLVWLSPAMTISVGARTSPLDLTQPGAFPGESNETRLLRLYAKA